jgi:16S rRNA (guanine966-N2)-methyltransferase
MGLRVIAGAARGRRLAAPAGRAVRPTGGLVRGALFNMLVHRGWLQDAVVLDLFAGSGALGIEALSRGAAHGYFVEQSASTGRVLRRNLEASGFADRTTVLATGVPQALRRLAADAVVMDGVLADPPYDRGWVARLLPLLAASPIVAPGGWIALEHAVGEPVPDVSGLHRVADRRHGRTHISLFLREEAS